MLADNTRHPPLDYAYSVNSLCGGIANQFNAVLQLNAISMGQSELNIQIKVLDTSVGTEYINGPNYYYDMAFHSIYLEIV